MEHEGVGHDYQTDRRRARLAEYQAFSRSIYARAERLAQPDQSRSARRHSGRMTAHAS